MTFLVVMLFLVGASTITVLLALNAMRLAVGTARRLSLDTVRECAVELDTSLSVLRERTGSFHGEDPGRSCST